MTRVTAEFPKSAVMRDRLKNHKQLPQITQGDEALHFFGVTKTAIAEVISQLNEMISVTESVTLANQISASKLRKAQESVDLGLTKIRNLVDRFGPDDKLPVFQQEFPSQRRFLDGSLAFEHTAKSIRCMSASQLLRVEFAEGTTRCIEIAIGQPSRQAIMAIPSSILADCSQRSFRLYVRGNLGNDQFQFASSSSLEQIAATLNLFADQTGVCAELTAPDSLSRSDTGNFVSKTTDRTGRQLLLKSVKQGADAFIRLSIAAVDPESGLDELIFQQDCSGDDMDATVDGVPANSLANVLQTPATNLDIRAKLDGVSQGDRYVFSVTGGGLLIDTDRLRIRIGIESMLPERWCVSRGRLYQIGSGQAHCLSADDDKSLLILQEAVQQASVLFDRFLQYESRLRSVQSTSSEARVPSRSNARLASPRGDVGDRFPKPAASEILVRPGPSLFQWDSADIGTCLKR